MAGTERKGISFASTFAKKAILPLLDQYEMEPHFTIAARRCRVRRRTNAWRSAILNSPTGCRILRHTGLRYRSGGVIRFDYGEPASAWAPRAASTSACSLRSREPAVPLAF